MPYAYKPFTFPFVFSLWLNELIFKRAEKDRYNYSKYTF